MYVIYDTINKHEKFQVTTVCHSFTINEGKNIALSSIPTRVRGMAGTDPTTEPPDLDRIKRNFLSDEL